jgi:hypothetical protein
MQFILLNATSPKIGKGSRDPLWLGILLLLARATEAGPAIGWDPPELPESWWLPDPSIAQASSDMLSGTAAVSANGTAAAGTHDAAPRATGERPGRSCAALARSSTARTYVIHGARAGGLNNRMLILLNAVQLVATQDPPARLLISMLD